MNLNGTAFIVIAVFLCGISSSIEKTSANILRADYGHPRAGWSLIGPLFTDSWISFWLFTVLFGAVGGFFSWKIGGWWYRVRIQWSGAVEPDHRRVREIYIFASLIVAIPTVLATVARSVFFENFGAALSSEEFYSGILVVFPIWSIIVGYIGVRANFDLVRWKALLLLVVLPGLIWAISMGLLVFAMTQFDN